MNINKTKTSIALMTLFLSSHIFAQDNSPYVELHKENVAADMYDAYKSGNGSDPFNSLDSGYKERYARDYSNNVAEFKSELVSSFLENEENDLLNTRNSLSKIEGDSLQSLYESHIDSEGNFDAEAYAESYEAYIDSKRLARESSVEGRAGTVNSLLEEGYRRQNEHGIALENDVLNAQFNLIRVMDARKSAKKSELAQIYDESSNRVSDYMDRANETNELANIYADCGNACDIPPPLEDDDKEEEEECRNDSNNYWLFVGGQYYTSTYVHWDGNLVYGAPYTSVTSVDVDGYRYTKNSSGANTRSEVCRIKL